MSCGAPSLPSPAPLYPSLPRRLELLWANQRSKYGAKPRPAPVARKSPSPVQTKREKSDVSDRLQQLSSEQERALRQATALLQEMAVDLKMDSRAPDGPVVTQHL